MFTNVFYFLFFFWSIDSEFNIYLANYDFSCTGAPVIIINSDENENSEIEKIVKLQEIKVKNENESEEEEGKVS